ncbi:MAG: glycosyltransferase family 4 protein [Planctomycetota bacterium]|jgi:UDP-glucose:(heptosyl)LPS alpha-1,3-glucosyltransferase
MRVGLVVEQLDPLRGGKEQWSAQFASKLLERGHEVHVVASRFGHQVRTMPIVRHPLKGARSPVDFAEGAEQKLRSLSLDVVHDTGAGWYCDVFQPHGGSRRALIEHNLLALPRWLRPMKRMVNRWLPRYRRFETLMQRQYVNDGRIWLALSRQTQEDFRAIHGVPEGRVRLGYNGVDTLRFSPDHRLPYREAVRRWLGVDDHTLVMLIVAHNFTLKGVPTLIRAMGPLAEQRRPVHLVVVGGKRLRRYERAAARLGAAANVTFTGTVHDTVPFYAAADVYVHPTFHDSCSLVVLEALASGLPVITSRLNGAAELLAEGREGYVMSDPTDVDDLLAKLEPLLGASVRHRMGQAARRLALEHTLDRNVNEVLAVYEEVIRDRPTRRGQVEPAVYRSSTVLPPPGAVAPPQTKLDKAGSNISR